MNYGALFFYIWCFIGLLIGAYEHGKPRTGNNSFWLVLLGMTIFVILLIWSLGWRLM